LNSQNNLKQFYKFFNTNNKKPPRRFQYEYSENELNYINNLHGIDKIKASICTNNYYNNNNNNINKNNNDNNNNKNNNNNINNKINKINILPDDDSRIFLKLGFVLIFFYNNLSIYFKVLFIYFLLYLF
jgi:peptidyl-prolyl cis-trans isomerase SDCCAG10